MSHSLRPHGLLHARLPCPSLSPGICSNSCPLSQWCLQPSCSLLSPSPPTFNLQSLLFTFSSHPASGSFLMSQLFISGGQSIGASASASVLPMNIQGWFPLGNLHGANQSTKIIFSSLYTVFVTLEFLMSFTYSCTFFLCHGLILNLIILHILSNVLFPWVTSPRSLHPPAPV